MINEREEGLYLYPNGDMVLLKIAGETETESKDRERSLELGKG